MALVFRQVVALTVKNLRVALLRHPFSTPFRAFILPVIFIAFLSYARNLFIPPSIYGIGESSPVRGLGDALALVSESRQKLIFVNNGFTGGDIEVVIDQVAGSARQSGKEIEVISNEGDLTELCRNSLRGTSSCIAAAVFYSSPDEGPGGQWNYSLRADGALGRVIKIDSTDNDAQVYLLPLQHAIDSAITRTNPADGTEPLPDEIQHYPYTSRNAEEQKDFLRVRYMGGIIDILAVAFFIGMVGTTYQLTGLIAAEREIGMAQLLDCMMPNAARWQPQFVRILANHAAFDLIYVPGWVVMGIILSIGVFSRTSAAVVIIFHVLSGLSLCSTSVLGGAFFRKAQLSGITLVIGSLLLAIVAQVCSKASTGAVAVLSLLFPPMTHVYFVILMARWERQNMATSMVDAAPENPSTLPGIAFWVFLVVQIIVFPLLGALVERSLYGTASKSRAITRTEDSTDAVTLRSFTKEFRPGWLRKTFGGILRINRERVLAVDGLSFAAAKGQIMVLLGANGSGKSTTLDAIAGLASMTSGAMELNFPPGAGGFGLCPQKNVLWDNLTVEEHVSIFNQIKCTGKTENKQQIHALLADCDVGHKLKARAKTLSGGQKRKLQLAMMFTGGSSVCAVDEVSSGLDPISRRKIWDILLSERGSRSIILTTHFLDEADLLSDHIAILSKGSLRAEGTAVELKHKFGSGYRVHLYNHPDGKALPEYPGIPSEKRYDQTIYNLEDSAQTSRFVSQLDNDGIDEYQVSGPSIEDVFLKLAEEAKAESSSNTDQADTSASKEGNAVSVVEKSETLPPELLPGQRIGMIKQAKVLFGKRWTVLKRNRFPYLAALLIPVIAAGLVSLFLKDFVQAGCTPQERFEVSEVESLINQIDFRLVFGPQDRILPALRVFAQSLPGQGGASTPSNLTTLRDRITFVDTLDEFNEFVESNYSTIIPGGFFLGDDDSPPTFAWKGNGGDVSFASITQNILDVVLTNTTISTQYQPFDLPWAADVGKALQLITYFGLAMTVYPAFLALYPTVERLRNVRALHYSNGVRSLPLWSAYVSFDFVIVLATSIVCTVIFRAVTNIWYHLEYLFVVFFLYGLASTLFSYFVSLVARSQLAAFAFAAGYQAVTFLLYFIAYMSILTYSPTTKIDSHVNIAHFTIALISPSANLTRAFFIALNVFSLTCRDRDLASYAGEMTLYGGPILYLILQSVVLFLVLLWWDSDSLLQRLRPKFNRAPQPDSEDISHQDPSTLSKTSTSSGLRVQNISKSYKSLLAVDNVSFSVPRSSVFALLGPNGAGKSTLISLIRGDIQPSAPAGNILVEDASVITHRALARSYLGVCPQFDATDTMSVREHLDFYARIRGVPDPTHNVSAVLRAVGLQGYETRMAAKLSGGNKRKLSLGIALMGNPRVLLLDEPSSGMDAAAKRVMWRTLRTVVPGRSLVLTTHSMEEADALAQRAGVVAGRLLQEGDTGALRRRWGGWYYGHLVLRDRGAGEDAVRRVTDWLSSVGGVLDGKIWAGQIRFKVPVASSALTTSPAGDPDRGVRKDEKPTISSQVGERTENIITPLCSSSSSSSPISTPAPTPSPSNQQSSSIAILFTLLEANKADLGIAYYSLSQTTLDQVFLAIVGEYSVRGEDHGKEAGNGEADGDEKKETGRGWKRVFSR